MKSFYFRFTPSSSSSGRWTQETAAAVGGVTGEVAGCSSARSRPRLRCTGRRGVLAAGLMTPWPGHGWPGSATPSCCGRPGSVQGTARRDESRPQWLATVLPWLAAVGRVAWERRRRGAWWLSLAEERRSTGRPGLVQVPGSRWGKERERVERRVLVLDLSTARWQRGHGRWQRGQPRRATLREQPARWRYCSEISNFQFYLKHTTETHISCLRNF